MGHWAEKFHYHFTSQTHFIAFRRYHSAELSVWIPFGASRKPNHSVFMMISFAVLTQKECPVAISLYSGWLCTHSIGGRSRPLHVYLCKWGGALLQDDGNWEWEAGTHFGYGCREIYIGHSCRTWSNLSNCKEGVVQFSLLHNFIDDKCVFIFWLVPFAHSLQARPILL